MAFSRKGESECERAPGAYSYTSFEQPFSEQSKGQKCECSQTPTTHQQLISGREHAPELWTFELTKLTGKAPPPPPFLPKYRRSPLSSPPPLAQVRVQRRHLYPFGSTCTYTAHAHIARPSACSRHMNEAKRRCKAWRVSAAEGNCATGADARTQEARKCARERQCCHTCESHATGASCPSLL